MVAHYQTLRAMLGGVSIEPAREGTSMGGTVGYVAGYEGYGLRYV